MLTVKFFCDILSKIMGSYANKVLGGVKNDAYIMEKFILLKPQGMT